MPGKRKVPFTLPQERKRMAKAKRANDDDDNDDDNGSVDTSVLQVDVAINR